MQPDPNLDHVLDAVKARSARQSRTRRTATGTGVAGLVVVFALVAIGLGSHRDSDRDIYTSTAGSNSTRATKALGEPSTSTSTEAPSTTESPTSTTTSTEPSDTTSSQAPRPTSTTVEAVPPPSSTTTRVVLTLPPTTPVTTVPPPCVCEPPNPGGTQLADAKAAWAAHRPQRYSMTVRRSCFCPPEVTKPVMVTVDGTTVTSPPSEATLTVDDFYAEADRIGPDGRIVTLEIDPTFGYPTRLDLDPITSAVDDEMSYTITDFMVL